MVQVSLILHANFLAALFSISLILAKMSIIMAIVIIAGCPFWWDACDHPRLAPPPVLDCTPYTTLYSLTTILSRLVTPQVSLLLRRLQRQGEGERRGHPAPRQGACKAPWNPLLNRYLAYLL